MKKLTLLICLFISTLVAAQPFSMVKEINSTANGNSITSTLMAQVGSTVYFIATDGNTGSELWKTDGTEQGTVIVKDITPGPGSTSFFLLTAGNDLLFFVANDGISGIELWRSDGTESGTYLLKDINPGSASSAINRSLFHNGLLFFGADNGTQGQELWKSDGTTAGTVMVKDINPGPTASSPGAFSNPSYTFVAMGNEIFFAALDPAAGRELYKTDGTEAGTVLVKDIWPGASSGIGITSHKAAVHNGRLYFDGNDGVNGIELWSTDGTEQGTSMVKDIVAGLGSSQPNNLVSFNGNLYFSASPVNNGNPNLYKTDGTVAGTVLVRDLVADGILLSIGNSAAVNDFTVVLNKLFFRVNAGPNGLELYVTDGTTSGTGLVKDIFQGVNSSSPIGFLEMNGKLYFTAFDPAMQKNVLFSSDGTEAGTVSFIDGELGDVLGISSVNIISTSSKLFFLGNTQDGIELWNTDGTSAGTFIVKNINTAITGTPNTSTNPFSSVEMNGFRYFAAGSPDHGMELWKSNGTTAGTTMVKDLWPGKGPSSPMNFFVHGGYIYFSANDGVHGIELWRTDGTESGTVLIKDIWPGVGGSNPSRFTLSNNFIYFVAYNAANGNELWRTDGTEGGTTLVLDLVNGPATGLNNIIEGITVTDDAFFIAGISPGNSLGIAGGTKLIRVNGATNTISEFSSIIAFAQDITVSGNTLYIGGRNAANQTILWKTVNGGAIEQVKTLSTTASNVFQLTDCAGKIYFSASDGVAGIEPWVSDGSEAGTFMLKDINPGSGNSTPYQYVLSGGNVFFTAAPFVSGGNSNYEIYITNGTIAGTYLLKDIIPGSTGSRPSGTMIAYPGNKVLFTANDGVNGIELWQSDGTNEGTTLLQDFNMGSGDGFNLPGVFNNFPSEHVLNRVGDGLVFFARNAVTGFQLYGGSMSAKYYVNDNSQTGDVFTTAVGNNANPGTASAPFGSIDYAYSVAKNGDTICVDAGEYVYAGDQFIEKGITLLGVNYNTSPNDATDAKNANAAWVAETKITGATFTILSNDIKIKGFTLDPGLRPAVSLNNTPTSNNNFGNLIFENNRFIVTQASSQVILVGVGTGTTQASSLVNSGFSISNNRFEKSALGGGSVFSVHLVKNVSIDNNSFVIGTGGAIRTATAISMGNIGVIDNVNITNNTVDRFATFVTGNQYANVSIVQNKIFNTTTSMNISNSMSGASNIDYSNNLLNGSGGIMPFSQYVRNGGNDVGSSTLFKAENNQVSVIAAPVTTTILGAFSIQYGNSVQNQSVIVRGNSISVGGDVSTVEGQFIRPITIRGNLGNATVENNEISFSAISLQPKNPSNVLPVCPAITLSPENGAAAVLQPSAVVNIRNNKVHGFKHSFVVFDPVAGANPYVGFGNLPSGVTVNVNNNSFTGDSISINNGEISYPVQASCNWYGSTDLEILVTKVSTETGSYIPWITNGTDNEISTPGFQPVNGSCNGIINTWYVNDNDTSGDVFTTATGSDENFGFIPSSPFATLQHAVNEAQPGDVIYVDAGTYIANVIINKPVVMLGARYDQNPGSSLDRGNETIVIPSITNLNLTGGSVVRIASANVTINGFTIDGNNPNLNNGTLVNGVDVNAATGIFNDDNIVSDITVKNNIVKNTGIYGIGMFRTYGNTAGPVVSGNQFTQNRVDNIGSRGIVFAYSAYGSITNNYITRCVNSGTWFSQINVANLNNNPGIVSGNYIEAGNTGMQSSSLGINASAIHYENNHIVGKSASALGLSLLIANLSGIQVSNNKFTDLNTGIAANNTGDQNNMMTVTITNNSFENISNLIFNIFNNTYFNASCNWYGSAAVQDFINKLPLTANLDIVPWLTNGTDNDAATGFQPVPGSCDGYPTLIILNSSTNVTCNGAANGSINITASNGKPPYIFTWTKDGDPGFISNAEDPTGLAPGTYTLSILDGNGSNIYITDPEAEGPGTVTVTITEPDVLTANVSGTNVSCFNGSNGTAAVLVGGGTAPYTYLWNNGATTSSISNLSAGLYSVIVSDANGCTAQANYQVTQPALLTANVSGTNVSCFNGSNGSAAALVGGGTEPYTYLWNNGATTSSISNLSAGLYSVIVSDANGCTAQANYQVTQPALLTANVSGTNVSCFNGSNGSAAALVGGGTEPYTYLWNNGATTSSISNLTAGLYSVIVSDANGCTVTAQYDVTQPTQLVTIATGLSTSCVNSASASVDGGNPPYSYLWSNGATSASISSIPAGTYNVTVTDNNGCTATASVTVTGNQAFNPSVSVTNVSCFGTGTGSLTVTNANGVAPFTYSLDGINFQSSNVFSGLYAGTYTLTVKDALGCTGFKTKTITEPSQLIITLIDVQSTCFGQNTGSISVSVSGGSPSYSYQWTGPNGFTSTQLNQNNRAAGTYILTVTDRKGCTAQLQVTIPFLPEIAVNSIETNVQCRGESSGTIDLTVNGGTGNGFTYLWNNGSTTEDRTNLGAGNYSVTITDAGSGCVISRNFTITQPSSNLRISLLNKTDVNGCISDGSIEVVGTGGTAPYEYRLNNGNYQSSGLFTGLAGTAAGLNYTVWVRDANGCTFSKVYVIKDDGKDIYENNGTKNRATAIGLGATISAKAVNTDIDYFKLNGTNTWSGNYNLSLVQPSPSVSYFLTTSNGTTIVAADDSSATHKQYNNLVNGNYFVRVTGGPSYECYQLTITNTLILRMNTSTNSKNEVPVMPVTEKLRATVFPNPHQGSFTLQIDSPEEGMALIQLLDANGRLVATRNKMLLKGNVNTVSYNNIRESVLFYRIILNKHNINGKIIGQY